MMGFRSKRSVLKHYGFNSKTFNKLIEEGIIKAFHKDGKRASVWVEESSLVNLREGEHYVVCRECNAWQFQITTKHLQSCSGMSLSEYRVLYPDAPVLSAFSKWNKRKTEAQRAAQSCKLLERFKTEEGELTRQAISRAAKKLHVSGYRQVATANLKAFRESEKGKKFFQELAKRRWQDGSLEEDVRSWHTHNRNRSLSNIAAARQHMKRTSNLHLRFKEALINYGIEGFQTEYSFGWYSLDEAHPHYRIAIEIDGCYWHRCALCGYARDARIELHDGQKTEYLKRKGWHVLRFWEHEIRSNLDKCLETVREALILRA